MLDISDADIHFLGLRESELEDDIDEENDEQIEKSVTKNLKTLVVSFKMIGINTYNVFVIDLESHLDSISATNKTALAERENFEQKARESHLLNTCLTSDATDCERT